MRILVAFLVLVLTSCGVTKIDHFELLSPDQNAYWGYQVLQKTANKMYFDSSFYPDLRLQPFVESQHFYDNRRFNQDLDLSNSKHESIVWLYEVDYSTIKRVAKASENSDGICKAFDINLTANGKYETITVYLPQEQENYVQRIEREMHLLAALFQPPPSKYWRSYYLR